MNNDDFFVVCRFSPSSVSTVTSQVRETFPPAAQGVVKASDCVFRLENGNKLHTWICR